MTPTSVISAKTMGVYKTSSSACRWLVLDTGSRDRPEHVVEQQVTSCVVIVVVVVRDGVIHVNCDVIDGRRDVMQ